MCSASCIEDLSLKDIIFVLLHFCLMKILHLTESSVVVQIKFGIYLRMFISGISSPILLPELRMACMDLILVTKDGAMGWPSRY